MTNFNTITLERETEKDGVDEKPTIEKTYLKEIHSIIKIKKPLTKDLMEFEDELVSIINNLKVSDQKLFLDDGLYRLKMEQFLRKKAHKYIFSNTDEQLYETYEELAEEENIETLSEVLTHVYSFFFIFSPFLRLWNVKKWEEMERMKQMEITALLTMQAQIPKELESEK